MFVAGLRPVQSGASATVSGAVSKAVSPFAPGGELLPPLPEATRVLAADGNELGTFGANEARHLIEISELPPHVWQAVLAAEDAGFYGHSGFEPTSIARALYNRVAHGSVQGGSTITQQLAKINGVGDERTLSRKLRELRYAAALEATFTKDQLLTRYLNQVYFGDGAYGFEEAARTTFGRPAASLSVAQAAALAGRIQNPNRWDPRRSPTAAQDRRNHVLQLMHTSGWLSSADLPRARAEPLDVLPLTRAAPRAKDFMQLVRSEALELDALGSTREERERRLESGGYKIETTFDRENFEQARTAVEEELGSDPATPAHIVTVQPGDGGIRTVYSRSRGSHEMDVATQSRPPGSSFNLFLYLTALEAGIDPRSQFLPSPRQPHWRGPVSLDDAFVQGLEPVFATLRAKVGEEPVRRIAERVGFSQHPAGEQRCGAPRDGIPEGVAPLEQAAAFATIAAGGLYAEPYAIAQIRDRDGNIVHTHASRSRRVMDPGHAGVLGQALSRAARRAGFPPPFAGTAGGTPEGTDSWFIGVAKQLVTTAWVGSAPDAGPTAPREGEVAAGFGAEPAVGRAALAIYARTLRPLEEPLEPPRGAAPDRLGLSVLPPTTVVPIAERPLPALPIAGPPAMRSGELRGRVIQALERSGATTSAAVVEVEGLGAVVDFNGTTPLRTASTQKIFTAGAVLSALGPERRLQTRVARSGELLADGTLVGDLVVIAGGDPDLGSQDLESLAAGVRATGISRVSGDVVIDDTLFDRERVPQGWDPSYVPGLLGPLSAFAVDRNEWRCDPDFLADPTVANGERLKQALAGRGVVVEGGVALGQASGSDETVATHESPPVGQLVRGILKYSDSFRAEMLYKQLRTRVREKSPAILGARQGAAALPLGRAADGSGLSTESIATASAEVAWLRALEQTPVGPAFRSSLPAACEGGTLRWRLCDEPARGQVRAKTGTLNAVANLSGYTTTASGRKVWFALLLSGVDSVPRARQAQDQAVLEIVNFAG